MTAEPKPHSTDSALTQTDRNQEDLAQNENLMPSTLTPQQTDEFETILSPADKALLLQLTNGLEQRSAAAPAFAPEAILRQITGGNPSGVGNTANPDKNRKRKLAAFTVAVAGLAATPFAVRPAITAIRGKEKPVVVATTSSAMPKFIVGAFSDDEYSGGMVFPLGAGMDRIRLRKGDAVIDIFSPGNIAEGKGPNGELPVITPIMIGSAEGKKIERPWFGTDSVEYY
jgi:hypothetical protein